MKRPLRYIAIALFAFLSVVTFISCPAAPPVDPIDEYNPNGAPAGPKNVKATNGYEGTITLTWDPVDNATSYQIWMIESSEYGAISNDEEITKATISSIQIFMYGIIPLAFQYCFVDCLTALAKPKAAAFCSLFRKTLIIASTFLFPLFMGVMGCFYAEMISDIISSTVTTIFFIIAFPKIMHRRLLLNPIFKHREK